MFIFFIDNNIFLCNSPKEWICLLDGPIESLNNWIRMNVSVWHYQMLLWCYGKISFLFSGWCQAGEQDTKLIVCVGTMLWLCQCLHCNHLSCHQTLFNIYIINGIHTNITLFAQTLMKANALLKCFPNLITVNWSILTHLKLHLRNFQVNFIRPEFSVAKVTLHSQMSVHLFFCHKSKPINNLKSFIILHQPSLLSSLQP